MIRIQRKIAIVESLIDEIASLLSIGHNTPTYIIDELILLGEVIKDYRINHKSKLKHEQRADITIQQVRLYIKLALIDVNDFKILSLIHSGLVATLSELHEL